MTYIFELFSAMRLYNQVGTIWGYSKWINGLKYSIVIIFDIPNLDTVQRNELFYGN